MGSWDNKHKQLELLDLLSWTWATKKEYSIQEADISMFATLYYNDSMFVFGGNSRFHTRPLDTIKSYNPKTDSWTDRGTLLTTHRYHHVIFSSGWFLVLGDQSRSTKSEKCVLDGDSLVCEQQETTFGSVEYNFLIFFYLRNKITQPLDYSFASSV